jgi:uncharacterized membrane protein YheB (UPF0754 family)
MHESESEAYLRLKSGEGIHQPKDTGEDRRKGKKPKNKENKKNFIASKRGALNATNMLYHSEEKNIQQYYTKELIALVIKEKSELSIVDALIIDIAAYATVRLYRKSRLESTFGRFMDRSAPQDPAAQILQCIKALNLKSAAKAESTKEILAKLITDDLDDNQEESMSFEEWRKIQSTGGMPKIQRRAMTEFAEDENKYKVALVQENEVDIDIVEIFEEPI